MDLAWEKHWPWERKGGAGEKTAIPEARSSLTGYGLTSQISPLQERDRLVRKHDKTLGR